MVKLHADATSARRRWLDEGGRRVHFGAMLIYKIFRASEWEAFAAAGSSPGAPVDLADGFIHFSTAVQAPETAAKHFAGEDALVLVAVAVDRLGTDLKWEPSRGGALFPHLYRELDATDVSWSKPLPLGPKGHIFPGDML